MLLSHTVKVVKSVHADRDLSKKNVIARRETRNEELERQGRAFTCHQVASRMLKSLFEVQLGILPFTFSALCSTVTLTKHSLEVRRL